MNSLFNHAVKQSQQLKRDLDVFSAAPAEAPLSLQGQISASLTSFARTIQDYANAAANEMIADKKERALARIQNFRDELQQAKDQFGDLKRQREDALHAVNRQDLFGRRPGRGGGSDANVGSSENPYDHPVQEAVDRRQGLAHENDVLLRAGQQLDDFIEQGRRVLGDLSEQSQMLQRTRQGMLSVAATLGVSNDTIRLVSRRAREDKWFFYGGIVVMLVCFYYILRWFG